MGAPATDGEIMGANLSMLFASLVATLYSCSNTFLWNDYSERTNAMKHYKSSMNGGLKGRAWIYHDWIITYFGAAVWGTGFLMQLLAMMGVVDGSLNVSTWHWVVYRFGQLMWLAYLTLVFINYESMWTWA